MSFVMDMSKRKIFSNVLSWDITQKEYVMIMEKFPEFYQNPYELRFDSVVTKIRNELKNMIWRGETSGKGY